MVPSRRSTASTSHPYIHAYAYGRAAVGGCPPAHLVGCSDWRWPWLWLVDGDDWEELERCAGCVPAPWHVGVCVLWLVRQAGASAQLHRCLPSNGDRSHRFTEVLLREGSWRESCELCEPPVRTRRVTTSSWARGIAGALMTVGAGLPIARRRFWLDQRDRALRRDRPRCAHQAPPAAPDPPGTPERTSTAVTPRPDPPSTKQPHQHHKSSSLRHHAVDSGLDVLCNPAFGVALALIHRCGRWVCPVAVLK